MCHIVGVVGTSRNLTGEHVAAGHATGDGRKERGKLFISELRDEYPTIFVANVTKKKIFLVNSTAVVGASGEAGFTVPLAAYGEASDEFSGFMLATGSKIVLVGFGTLAVTKRPARQGRNPRTGQ